MIVIQKLMRYLGIISMPFLIFAGIGCRWNTPQRTVMAKLTYAPHVPPPIHRNFPAIVKVNLETYSKILTVNGTQKYKFWTFNGHVPGPFIRARVGDILEIHLTNRDKSGMPHSIDLHCVTGPGGGAAIDTAVPGHPTISRFKLLYPGLFIYHCGTPPMMEHIANGMYGLILVEPRSRLPKVNKEYYILQSEIYARPSPKNPSLLQYSPTLGLAENPTYVVFNGRVGSLFGNHMLHAHTGDTVRFYFGNIGPNKIASLHIVGTVMNRVYSDGSLSNAPKKNIQTILVPCGGAVIMDVKFRVPGIYTLVDHSMAQMQKGAMGFILVAGHAQPSIYTRSHSHLNSVTP
jgi:copper-containing nitrite reductase